MVKESGWINNMLYDFQCDKCSHTFEELVNKDEPNPLCPHCQAATIKLLCAPQHYSTAKSDMFDHFVKRYPGLKEFKD